MISFILHLRIMLSFPVMLNLQNSCTYLLIQLTLYVMAQKVQTEHRNDSAFLFLQLDELKILHNLCTLRLVGIFTYVSCMQLENRPLIGLSTRWAQFQPIRGLVSNSLAHDPTLSNCTYILLELFKIYRYLLHQLSKLIH